MATLVTRPDDTVSVTLTAMVTLTVVISDADDSMIGNH